LFEKAKLLLYCASSEKIHDLVFVPCSSSSVTWKAMVLEVAAVSAAISWVPSWDTMSSVPARRRETDTRRQARKEQRRGRRVGATEQGKAWTHCSPVM
jgi:hypothetical protein